MKHDFETHWDWYRKGHDFHGKFNAKYPDMNKATCTDCKIIFKESLFNRHCSMDCLGVAEDPERIDDLMDKMKRSEYDMLKEDFVMLIKIDRGLYAKAEEIAGTAIKRLLNKNRIKNLIKAHNSLKCILENHINQLIVYDARYSGEDVYSLGNDPYCNHAYSHGHLLWYECSDGKGNHKGLFECIKCGRKVHKMIHKPSSEQDALEQESTRRKWGF